MDARTAPRGTKTTARHPNDGCENHAKNDEGEKNGVTRRLKKIFKYELSKKEGPTAGRHRGWWKVDKRREKRDLEWSARKWTTGAGTRGISKA